MQVFMVACARCIKPDQTHPSAFKLFFVVAMSLGSLQTTMTKLALSLGVERQKIRTYE